MRSLGALLLILAAAPALAQESQLASDLRREGQEIRENCGDLKKIANCAVTLATDYPFHVAIGSLAPQNGMGFGLAFVERYTPNERWRLSWNADAVGTPSGSWRAGAYMKVIHTPDRPVTVVRRGGSTPGSPAAGSPQVAIREYPVLNVYAQTVSLEKLFFYGIGSSSVESGRSVFGERQTIVGASGILPISTPAILRALRTSLAAGINGRSVTIRSNRQEVLPSIEQLYDDQRAPGLMRQPAFTQFEEGIRFKPSTPNGRLRFNYFVGFQQFLAAKSAQSSFHRWTLDLRHEIPIYRTVTSRDPRETNGPDECFVAVGTNRCPPLSYSRNREGAVTIRFLRTTSVPFSGHRVPFYFQPTLGGSDVNGQRLLPGFEDYRFRGPNLIAMQETVEHSIWGPLGAYFQADQGKVTGQAADLNLRSLEHSFAAGLTVRAGGFPLVNLSFAWGGGGHHLIGSMDASLTGGTGRPSQH